MANGATPGIRLATDNSVWKEGRLDPMDPDRRARWTTAFDPSSGLYYVQTMESCGIYYKRPASWEAGRGFMGGSSRNAPSSTADRAAGGI